MRRRETARPIREASGQDLVPVLDDEGFIAVDSSRIIEHLEERFPDPPLLPAETGPAGRGAGVRRLVQPGVEGAAESRSRRSWPRTRRITSSSRPSPPRCARRSRSSRRCSTAATTCIGDDFGAADCAAFPFLKYGLWLRDDDDERFHRILAEHLSLDGRYPRIEDWLRRVDERPRVAGVIVHPAHG